MTENTAHLKPEALAKARKVKLDKKGLRAATEAMSCFASYDTPNTLAEDCIRAYLSASPVPQQQGVKELDDLAAIFWRTEAEDVGAPPSVAAGRTRDKFDEQAESTKETWRKFARAALTIQEPASEPVAWRWRYKGDDEWRDARLVGEERGRIGRESEREFQPLCTHPPAPAVPADDFLPAVQVHSADTLPQGDEYLVAKAGVHEGAIIALYGTNDKLIGWIDTNAWTKGRVYRDNLLPTPPNGGAV